MGKTIALLVGSALGYWLAASRGQSVAVRVACGLGWIVLEIALLLGAMPWWGWSTMDMAAAAAIGFAVPVVVLGGMAAVESWAGAAQAGGGRRLAAIGAAVAVIVAGAWWILPSAEQGPPEMAQAVPIEAAPAADCPCAKGRLCEGPRGGRYCLTDAGNKRYQARQ